MFFKTNQKLVYGAFQVVNYVDLVNMAYKENTNKKRVTVEDILETVWKAPSDVSSDSDVGDSDIEPEIEFCNDNVPGIISSTTNGDDRVGDRYDACDMTSNVLDLVTNGYKKGASLQYKDTKTSNYCVKCNKFLCKSCFETYHIKSNFIAIFYPILLCFIFEEFFLIFGK